MTLQFWYMLPVSIGVATVAMASGVEGATFFAPIFLLLLGLPAEVAIGIGLVTEVFGFASGVTAYVRRKLIDYGLAGSLLMVTVPAAVIGSFLTGVVRTEALEAVLGMGLIAVALTFLRAPDHEELERLDQGVEADFGAGVGETSLVTAEGEEISYTVCNRTEGQLLAGLGALFMGMVSTGLGELNGYFLLRRCRVPSRVAVGTGVVVVAVTALSAATIHLWRFSQIGGGAFPTVLNVCLFTVPGVIVGGQLGPIVASRLPQETLERTLGVVFALVGMLMLWRVAQA